MYFSNLLEQLESSLYIRLVFLVLVRRHAESGALEIRRLPKLRRTVPSQLNTHMLPARFHEFTDIIGSLFDGLAVGVTIGSDRKTALAAQKLMKGHIGPLCLNVPQRLIQAAQRAVQDRTVPPVGTYIGGLPHVLDERRVTS